jgi:hypothetical protein
MIKFSDDFDNPGPENYVCLTCGNYEFQLVIADTSMLAQKIDELGNDAL